ncbi:RNA polymerase sigma-70 factor, ECF subfamily [Parapedobacter composti]|uniref:RNA polymerase sigma-70 factor, ECF subfamily n=1 Tax=Parapedobacter composti TaxID=623281 RepID=A0A1I1I9H8_9SPHI|nr:RNA polymerase sigma factor [Parapedobacter composti]SFC32691.1 RNA polymerase sigma-70 factor, ECF subfamily [Parapedobacter composti]
METCVLDERSVCKEAVFARFFREQVKTLRHFLYYRFGDMERASDVAQEAFAALWQHCDKVPYERAKPYLYSVAYRKMLKVKAHEKVMLTYSKNGNHETESFESPQFLLEEKQFKERLLRAIANLSDAQRQAFLMHRVDKLKYAEIAAVLGISVKAVEKRIHLAMLALKKTLTEFK